MMTIYTVPQNVTFTNVSQSPYTRTITSFIIYRQSYKLYTMSQTGLQEIQRKMYKAVFITLQSRVPPTGN